jgi:hypothetical protein
MAEPFHLFFLTETMQFLTNRESYFSDFRNPWGETLQVFFQRRVAVYAKLVAVFSGLIARKKE